MSLVRIRALIGDDREPYRLRSGEIVAAWREAGGSVPGAAADLRDLLQDRNASNFGPAWNRRTAELRAEANRGMFGPDGDALPPASEIPEALPAAFTVAVSTSENPAPGDFAAPREDGTVVVPDFDEPSYIYIGTTAETLTTVMTRRNQRGTWSAERTETEVLDGEVFNIYASRGKLNPSWSGLTLEVA